jgi:hypothetical protein
MTVGLVAMLAWLHAAVGLAAIQFSLGHFYTTDFQNKTTIVEYDENGSALGSRNISSAHELRGLAFGPDQLLYVVDSQPDHFDVLALDRFGAVQRTYSHADPGGIRSLISAGHIVFDGMGHFYVDHFKFTIGSPNSGQDFFTGAAMHDVAIGPNGNLLGINDHDLFEITPSGEFVRSIGPSPGSFFNRALRAVAYDPQSDSIYVAMLGDSSSPHPLLRLNGTSGALVESTTLSNATDLFVTLNHGVLVGSRSVRPTRLDASLGVLGFLEGTSTDRMFVTQLVPLVPEPSGIALLVAGLSLAAIGPLRRRWLG